MLGLPIAQSTTAGEVVHDTTIDSENLSVHILVLSQEQRSHAHLRVAPSTHGRNVALLLHLLSWQLTLLVVVRALGRHLRREVTRRDRVHADPCALELRAHELSEVDGSTLGGIVGEVALCVLHLSAHGGDSDDAGAEARQRALGLDSSLQEWQKSDGGEVDTRDVGVVSVVPVLHALVLPELLLHVTGVVVLGLGLGAGNSSSADEQVDVLLLGLEVLDESFEVVFLGDIGWADGDDGTAVVGIVGLCRLLERFGTTTGDVDL